MNVTVMLSHWIVDGNGDCLFALLFAVILCHIVLLSSSLLVSSFFSSPFRSSISLSIGFYLSNVLTMRLKRNRLIASRTSRCHTIQYSHHLSPSRCWINKYEILWWNPIEIQIIYILNKYIFQYLLSDEKVTRVNSPKYVYVYTSMVYVYGPFVYYNGCHVLASHTHFRVLFSFIKMKANERKRQRDSSEH